MMLFGLVILVSTVGLVYALVFVDKRAFGSFVSWLLGLEVLCVLPFFIPIFPEFGQGTACIGLLVGVVILVWLERTNRHPFHY